MLGTQDLPLPASRQTQVSDPSLLPRSAIGMALGTQYLPTGSYMRSPGQMAAPVPFANRPGAAAGKVLAASPNLPRASKPAQAPVPEPPNPYRLVESPPPPPPPPLPVRIEIAAG